MPSQENCTQQLLESLRTKLLVMRSRTQQALDDAALAVFRRDLPRAAAVPDGDIDAPENRIDKATLGLLARTQPMARDLRFIMSSVRMVLDLERIGDEAVIIAEQVTLTDKPIPVAVRKKLKTDAAAPAPCSARLLTPSRTAPAALTVSRYDDETAQIMVNIFQKLVQAVSARTLDPWDAMHICPSPAPSTALAAAPKTSPNTSLSWSKASASSTVATDDHEKSPASFFGHGALRRDDGAVGVSG